MDNLLWRNGFHYHSWKFSHHRNTSKEKVSQAATFLADKFGLSFADLLVRFVTMLFLIDYNVSHNSVALSIAWDTLDIFAGLFSLFHLVSFLLKDSTQPFGHFVIDSLV